MELVEESEMASALSQLSTASSSFQIRHMEACSVASYALSENLMLDLSSSEEVGILSIEADDLEDSAALSPQYEELVKAIT